jgi:RimJ/RimL family protein N-acetyltransferase
LEPYKIAEIGRAMVAPEYRHKGLMNMITQELIIHAKKQGIQYLVATVHPQNIPSQKAAAALGMEKKEHCVKHGKYERDILLLKLH